MTLKVELSTGCFKWSVRKFFQNFLSNFQPKCPENIGIRLYSPGASRRAIICPNWSNFSPLSTKNKKFRKNDFLTPYGQNGVFEFVRQNNLMPLNMPHQISLGLICNNLDRDQATQLWRPHTHAKYTSSTFLQSQWRRTLSYTAT